MYDVTSWFQVQLEDRASEPVRQFLIGTSDYSDRVTKWPKIKHTSNNIVPVKPTMPLDNADGYLNHFYETTYKMVQTCYLKLGFTHPDSATEYATLYTGALKDVRYTKGKCNVYCRDKIQDFSERKVGDSDSTVVFSETIPSDIAWTLCTCYGGLCNSKDTANADIDYTAWLAWAAQFSADTLLMNAYYDGIKITEALANMCNMTDSAVWVDGEGKVTFKKFIEPDSNDLVLTRDENTDIQIDIEGLRVVNKAYVYWNYDPTSEYWAKTCFAQESTSVNTFGMHEEIYSDKTCWYCNSSGALNLAQRKVVLLSQPPKRFQIDTDLYAMRQELGETVRLVDSFYEITSGSGWRMSEKEIDMESGAVAVQMDEALTANAFYLDVSLLDGDDLLL